MTRDEAKKIIRVICAAYPNFHPADISETVDVWHLMLQEYEYNHIALAVKAYITMDSSGFAPSVGQVLEKYHGMTEPQELSEMEAWALVSKAIKRSIYYADEEWDKLPPLVQEAVASPGNLRAWAQTDSSNVESVIQSNFMRSYKTIVARKRNMQRMPVDVKAMIAEKAGQRMIEKGVRA